MVIFHSYVSLPEGILKGLRLVFKTVWFSWFISVSARHYLPKKPITIWNQANSWRHLQCTRQKPLPLPPACFRQAAGQSSPWEPCIVHEVMEPQPMASWNWWFSAGWWFLPFLKNMNVSWEGWHPIYYGKLFFLCETTNQSWKDTFPKTVDRSNYQSVI